MSIFLKREVLLVKFPIIFPLVYLFILYSFPIYENIYSLFIVSTLSFTCFINKENVDNKEWSCS